ncbi:hypothetical protein [Desulfosporosinus sp. I2]|uniref:hypothetical protein n=1 Tax=Desulfosporosinus sp. I2 TaxID=1617025 RepID=UPI001FA791F1|nr:hypothetical protein [Desulfosporosinus sp. I2]
MRYRFISRMLREQWPNVIGSVAGCHRIAGRMPQEYSLAKISGCDFLKPFWGVYGHAFHEKATLPDCCVSYIVRVFCLFKSGSRTVGPLVIQDKTISSQ